jgi:signal peptidase II
VSAFRHSKGLTWYILLAGLIVLVDQVTKVAITQAFSLHENLEVIPGVFSLTHIRNTGVAFGMLAGEVTWLRTLLFSGVSALALGIMVWLFTAVSPEKKAVKAAFAMIFGGALGNLIDRLRFGEVIDFLDFYIGDMHWPAFNVADSAMSIGLGFLLLCALFGKI